jgi:hypothetical protein
LRKTTAMMAGRPGVQPRERGADSGQNTLWMTPVVTATHRNLIISLYFAPDATCVVEVGGGCVGPAVVEFMLNLYVGMWGIHWGGVPHGFNF